MNFLMERAESKKRVIPSWFQLKFKPSKLLWEDSAKLIFPVEDSTAKKVNYNKNRNKMSLKHFST